MLLILHIRAFLLLLCSLSWFLYRLIILLLLLSGRGDGRVGLLAFTSKLLVLLLTCLERPCRVPPAHPEALHSGWLSIAGYHTRSSCSFLLGNDFVWGRRDKCCGFHYVLLLELFLIEVHLGRTHTMLLHHLVSNHNGRRNVSLLVLHLVIIGMSRADFCDSIRGHHRNFFFSCINIFLFVDFLLIRKFLVMGALVINFTLGIAF